MRMPGWAEVGDASVVGWISDAGVGMGPGVVGAGLVGAVSDAGEGIESGVPV
jgi:hypothetical protein